MIDRLTAFALQQRTGGVLLQRDAK